MWHCALSQLNFTLGSGVCNVRHGLVKTYKVDMGTDVAGGYSPSMLDAIRNARVASVAVTQISGRQNQSCAGLRCPRYYFTGHARLCRRSWYEGQNWEFEPGKDLDALVVDTSVEGSPTTTYAHDALLDRFQSSRSWGNDRNIRYCLGEEVVLERK